VFLTGDISTGRWRKQDLTQGVAVGHVYEGLTSDLRTEKAYVLGTGDANFTTYGQVTSLLEMNDSGALTGTRINLSTPVTINTSDSGILAGYGRIIIYNGSHAYDIAVPSGTVTDLGNVTIPSHSYSEAFIGFWGVAEYF